MLYLEATTESCSLKYAFLKYAFLQTHHTDSEDQRHHHSDAKLLHWQQDCNAYDYAITCIKMIVRQFVAEVCEDNLNAFSL